MLSRLGPRLGLPVVLLVLLALPHQQFWTPFAFLLAVPATIAVWRGEHVQARPWVAFIASFLAYVYLRRYADELGPGPFIDYVIAWERGLAFGTVPTLTLQQWYTPGETRWWDLAAIVFHLSHFFVAPIVAVALWRFRSPRLDPFLYGMSAMYLLSAGIHLAVPTAPPWIAGQLGHLPTVYLPQTDILYHWSPGLYGATLQTAGGNTVAAMPSVHASTAAGVALALRGQWAGLGWAYVGAMGVALVYLGHHYLVDVIAGVLVMGVGWWMATRPQWRGST